jgi:glycosyltransferase involved in cell wall biosynthesis
MMKISVIIPAYNREAFIATAIRSLQNQRTDADIDIVVVDDGSTDGTADIVARIVAEDPAVRLVRQQKSGVARARNTGLDNVHDEAELVTFLDSDDACAPQRFGSELGLFRNDPQLAMTYGMMTLTQDIDDALLVPPPGEATCTIRGIGMTTAIFRRAAIERVGRFNEDLRQSEDFDFLLRFFELPLKYLLLDQVSIFYRRHDGNMTKDKEESRKYFLRSLILSARRRRETGSLQEIPKFFDINGLSEAHNALLR